MFQNRALYGAVPLRPLQIDTTKHVSTLMMRENDHSPKVFARPLDEALSWALREREAERVVHKIPRSITPPLPLSPLLSPLVSHHEVSNHRRSRSYNESSRVGTGLRATPAGGGRDTTHKISDIATKGLDNDLDTCNDQISAPEDTQEPRSKEADRQSNQPASPNPVRRRSHLTDASRTQKRYSTLLAADVSALNVPIDSPVDDAFRKYMDSVQLLSPIPDDGITKDPPPVSPSSEYESTHGESSGLRTPPIDGLLEAPLRN